MSISVELSSEIAEAIIGREEFYDPGRRFTTDPALGLSVGADACIYKPYSVRQLVARVRALTSEKSSEGKREVDSPTQSRELPAVQ